VVYCANTRFGKADAYHNARVKRLCKVSAKIAFMATAAAQVSFCEATRSVKDARAKHDIGASDDRPSSHVDTTLVGMSLIAKKTFTTTAIIPPDIVVVAGTPSTASNSKATQFRNGMRTTSKYRGVCWDRNVKKWKSAFTVGGKRRHLGYFDKEEDAARAYDNACIASGRKSRSNAARLSRAKKKTSVATIRKKQDVSFQKWRALVRVVKEHVETNSSSGSSSGTPPCHLESSQVSDTARALIGLSSHSPVIPTPQAFNATVLRHTAAVAV